MTPLVRFAAVSLVTALLMSTTPTHLASADEVDPGRMMLVLDSSGSMKELAAGGQTKIAVAKAALAAVIGELPKNQQVGLRVYGAKVFSAKDKGACTDSQRTVELGTNNRAALRTAVTKYKPFGETPTGYALQEAGKDLGTEGQRTIVLVSDGEPTCAPDPCDVARKLSQDGIALKIDVVGLDVSGKARNQLRCIADAGNGTYYDADDAESLTESLTASSTRASRPFDLTGKPVKGTPDPASAPSITNGQYLDAIPASGSISYRVRRTVPGSTIHLGVTLKGVGGSVGNGVVVKLFASGPDAAASACEAATGFGNGIGVRDPLLYGSVSTWNSEPDDPCNTAKEIIATLETSVGGDEIARKPIEIAVYEEPPLADRTGGGLDPAPPAPQWTTLEPGAPTEVVPGTSIGNAPVVADGTYSGDLNPGESQVFAIPVDWGQNVQAQLDAKLTRAIIDAGGAGSRIAVNLIGPVRDESKVSFFGSEPKDWSTTALANTSGTPSFRTGAQTMGYLNRGASNSDTRGASLAGLRFIQVTFNVRGDEVNLPYTLTLKTNGTAGEGAPRYKKVKGLQAPSADSRLVTAVADVGAAKKTKSEKSATKSNDGGPLLPIALGVLGSVALAGAYVLLRRSRRS